MTIEKLAHEELTLSFEERQAIVDDASDSWINTLPLHDPAIDSAILDFNARMLPEIYEDYNHTAPEVRQSLQLDQRFFVLRGIANALHLDEHRAAAVADRMGVHVSVMFPAGKDLSPSDNQPPLFNYWSIITQPDSLAV